MHHSLGLFHALQVAKGKNMQFTYLYRNSAYMEYVDKEHVKGSTFIVSVSWYLKCSKIN